MDLQIRKADGITILDLSGKLTIGDASQSVRTAVRDLLLNGQREILINLSEVTYMDSAGVGSLVGSFVTINNQKGHLKLMGLTAKTRHLMSLARLLTVFDTYDEEAEALAAFKAS